MEFVIELVETKNGSFNKTTCEEGHWITNWKEGDDILNFNASKIVCTPLSVDVNKEYRCVSDEEYERLTKEREVKEKEMMEKERL